ncbi:unnamed protein product [Closterium sp. NIES-54]
MLALCREHRLEHRTKHIALRYFLARELQQRGQLRLAYVASEANTADIFTKALPPGDHQRFCTMLDCVPACYLPTTCCLLPACYLLPTAACLPPACCLLADACLLTACSLPACLPACLLPAAACLQPACLLSPACLLPAAYLPACLLPAAACLQPACCLPAACLLLAACCRLPACCLLPPACRLPACLLAACCCLPASCCPCLLPLPPASYMVPAASACCLLSPASCLKPIWRRLTFERSSLTVVSSNGVSLFDYVSGTAIAPAADAPALERSQWQTRDAAARLAIRNHLPITERAHFSQHKTAKTLGGEFSSDLLAAFCAEHGIRQAFTLPASPQQNGVAERRIGLVMEVARTSMIHAAAPHFLWPFAVRYATHQLNLWPRVSLPETSPTLLWTGKVGDASRFRVWGARAFVRDTTADKLSPRAIPCVFLGFVPYARGWQFYDPASRRVFASQDVTFDESVPFCRLFPYRTAPRPPPPPLFLAPVPPQVDPLPAPGPAPLGVSKVDPPVPAPVEVTGDSGPAASGAVPGGAELGGAESGGAELVEPRGLEPACEEPGGVASRGTTFGGAAPVCAEPGGAESGGELPQGSETAGSPAGGSSAGVAGPGGARTGSAGAAGAGGGAAGGPGATSGAGAAEGTGGAGGAGAAGGAGGAGGAGAAGGTGAAGGAGATHAGGTAQPRFLAPSPYTEQPGGLAERLRRPSSPSPRVPLPPPPASSLPVVADPASDRFRAEHSTFTRRLATVVTDMSFESAATSALVTELVAFAAHCRLDYAASLVAESICPPSVGGECALGTDVLEDRQEDLECLAAAAPHLVSMLLAQEGDPDAPDIPTPRSYAEAIAGTYVDEIPPPGANIVSGMWIFRVKRPPGSPPVFKARYVARGFTQREGVDFFQTFSPTPKMTTLWVLLHVAAQGDYELHSLDISTAFLQGSLHEEIWLRRPPSFTGSFPPSTHWSLRRPVFGLRQAPREWHDTLRTTLAALGFALSTADPSLFLRTDTSLPPFYVLVYVNDLVFATADTEALALVKLELQKRHTCTDLGELRSYLGLQIT